VHAILASRRDLPLRLHNLRLAGDLAEIRTADFRLTEGETSEFMEASGIELSQADVARLHQRSEGWAAGLRISLAGSPDPARFVAEFSGSSRMVAEYLLAEMLDSQPPDVQRLLLRTAMLDRVNGELADLLTGHAGSDRILLGLEDANAFVVSLDPARTWFRYHNLFTDLLRLELRRRHRLLNLNKLQPSSFVINESNRLIACRVCDFTLATRSASGKSSYPRSRWRSE
jgi:LuxR family maltose regulon positive regulatory protein